MNKKDCNIIQDLLPNYIEGLTSDETNHFVEAHLKECKICNETYLNMKEEFYKKETEEIENVNYLKGFRKDKIKSNIKTILIFIIIMIVVFTIAFHVFWHILKQGVYINVNDINVEYAYISDDNELETFLYSEKYKYLRLDTQPFVVMNQNGMREIHLKICGRDFSYNIAGTYENIKLDETIEKIYIEDKKGNLKEIWNKDTPVMTKEQWKNWYINTYIPPEIKAKYNGDYSHVLEIRGHEDEPFIWRQYYDDYYKNKTN